MAAYLATALFVGASGAWHLLRGARQRRPVRTMFSMAMWMVLVVAPIQIVIGDAHGLNTLEHQPAKIAAIEGHWENKPGESVPLILFGWPDMAAETTRYAVEIPYLGSLILTHSWNGQIPGLKEFPARRPAEFDHRVLDLPGHGRPGLPDDCHSACGACGCAGARRFYARGCSCASLCDGADRADRAFSPAGSPPRSAASRGWSTA